MLDLDCIRVDGGTQARVELNVETVTEYADAYRAGAQFPAIIVFYDGADYWLADGFHRYHGAREAGQSQIYEEVIPGSQRDAVLYSLGANAKHGLRRTNEDKYNSVAMLLNDAEWSQWSQQKISQICGVSREYVNRVSAKLSCDRSQDVKPAVRTVERNGKTYEQNTSNIGKAKSAAPTKPTASAEAPDVPALLAKIERQAAYIKAAEAAHRDFQSKYADLTKEVSRLKSKIKSQQRQLESAWAKIAQP